ncbi:MFS transporter [Chromobacterium sp. ATCC 53434]|uniref:MFS transporter n=1 Tax=Chromobacterium sp. (strain ATCC 53434 / SC 14030) TaxID=2059672 RepID=UPI00130542B9|nr:MFS transporter [Chromobacterium sp. ATCC 53434]
MDSDSKVSGHKRGGMAAVLICLFMAMLDSSAVNIALPTIAQAYHVDFGLARWVVLSYMLALTALVLPMGRLADVVGKRNIYVAGIVIFGVGSAACAMPASIASLLLSRVVQGVGAAIILALGPALVTELVPAGERGRAFGIMGAVVALGVIIGPSAGGALIAVLGWHSIFWLNIPLCVGAATVAFKHLNRDRPSERPPFDLAGTAALVAALTLSLLALSPGELGFLDALGGGGIWLAAVLMWLVFVWIERRSGHPIVEARLFGNAVLSLNLLAAFLSSVSIAATLLLLPFYLQNVLGFAVAKTGLLLAITPLVLTMAAPVSGIMADRFGAHRVIAVGLIIMAIGFVAASTLSTHSTSLEFACKFVLVGLGLGLFQSPNNALIMSAAEAGHAGIVSGLLAMTRLMGQTIGVALVGIIWSWRVFIHEGAARALAQHQVDALREVFIGLTVLTLLVLALSVQSSLCRKRAVASVAPSG